MTTANKITIFRVILIPVFLVLMYLRFPGHTYWAFGVFVLASLSDFADALRTGRPARADYHQTFHVLDAITAFDRSVATAQWIPLSTPFTRRPPMGE